MMSVKTLRVSRQGGAAFNTMKNTQIRCWAGWDCTHRPLAMSERSLIAELLPQTASSFGPPHPSRIVDRTPIGLAECPLLDLMSKSQSYMLYGRYHCRFRSYSSLGSRGQLRLSPPGSRCLVTPPALAMRDLLQVCRLRLSCCQHVKELCCVPQGGLALSILPGHGRHCSYATAVALIARGHEVDQTSECA